MTSATVLNGKKIAKALRQSIADHVLVLKDKNGLTPTLAVVLVGDNPASRIYVENKKKAVQKAGMASHMHELPADTAEDVLITLVRKLNANPDIHGILVQMPLPAHIDANAVIGAVDPAKDVDGLHPENMGKLLAGQAGLVPCTPLGCMAILKNIGADLSGLHAVVIGRSNLVGRPMAQLLLRENCTVTMAHSKTPDLGSITRQADILVVAAGKAGLVTGDMVKPGAIVLDVGITRLGDKIVGDVDFISVEKAAAFVTPVPGGVGPMTIACLLGNTVTAACAQKGIDIPRLS